MPYTARMKLAMFIQKYLESRYNSLWNLEVTGNPQTFLLLRKCLKKSRKSYVSRGTDWALFGTLGGGEGLQTPRQRIQTSRLYCTSYVCIRRRVPKCPPDWTKMWTGKDRHLWDRTSILLHTMPVVVCPTRPVQIEAGSPNK